MAKIPQPKIDSNIDFKPTNLAKHKGKTPEQISEIDPEYLIWAYREYGKSFCSTALYKDTMDDLKQDNRDGKGLFERMD